MKKTTKALLLCLCAMMLVVASVMGTLAYLTSKDEVKNTFTVGNVNLVLDETKVNKDGTSVEGAERVKENTYHLLPNHKYTKDPTVTVKANSEECYVRMIVTVTFKDSIAEKEGTKLENIFQGYEEDNWKRINYVMAEDGKSITYEYYYKETVKKNAEKDQELPALFTSIKVPADLTNETLAVFADMKIDIVAHAIQADGFETAAKAWEVFK